MKETCTSKIDASLFIAVIALASLTFMGILSETSLNIAYADLMSEFDVQASTVQWLTTGYLLILSIFIPLSTFLIKNFMTRRLFQAAVAIFLAGTTIGATASSFHCLLAGRLIMAVGTGMSLPLLTYVILERTPIGKRGLLLGIVGLVLNFAPAIGPCYGGLVMQVADWHWIFIAMIPIVAAVFACGSRTIEDMRTNDRLKVDWTSVIMATTALSSIVVAFSMSGTWGWNIKTLLLISTGLACTAIFVLRQSGIGNPLVRIDAFRHEGFSSGIAMLMIAQAVVLGCNFLMPIMLQKGIGYTSMSAALILLPGAAISGAMSPIVGSILGNRFKRFLISGFILLAATLITFISIPYSAWSVAICYTSFMFGASFIQVPAQTYSFHKLPQRDNVDASAIMNTLQQLSGAMGTALASSLLGNKSLGLLIQGYDTGKAYTDGFRDSLILFVALSVLGIALASSMDGDISKSGIR